MVYPGARNLSRGSWARPGLALVLIAGSVFFSACPAQVAWEEGQRNYCWRRKSLARRCFSYGLISNLQCQREETEEARHTARGDFTKAEHSPIRLTDLSCDRELIVTYAYCDSLIPGSCRTPHSSGGSAGDSESEESNTTARNSRAGAD